MDMAGVIELVGAVGGVDPACRDRDRLTCAVGAVARLRAWLDGQEVRLAAPLADVVSFPEQAIADAARTSLRDASRVLERAHTVEVMPALADALSAGQVSGAQVDVVGTALRRLEPTQRQVLVGAVDRLVTAAAGSG